MNRFVPLGLALTLTAMGSVAAYAQVKPETLVKQRQSAMVLQGKYFYPIRAMAQGKAPYDANVVTRNVGYLEPLSRMAWDTFVPGTREAKSGTLPAAFTDAAKFKEAQDSFQAEVSKLSDMVKKGGNEAAVKSQITAVDKTCSSCHDNFRERQ
jgi:cytochrome c556